MVYLTHYTTREAYLSILKFGKILNQNDRIKYGLIYSNQGSAFRKIGLNDTSNDKIINNEFEEGIGVFFRIENTLPRYKRNVVAIVFLHDILSKYSGWFINTEENQGFKLHCKSIFSGEYGTTIYDINSHLITERSELIIPNSINFQDVHVVI